MVLQYDRAIYKVWHGIVYLGDGTVGVWYGYGTAVMFGMVLFGIKIIRYGTALRYTFLVQLNTKQYVLIIEPFSIMFCVRVSCLTYLCWLILLSSDLSALFELIVAHSFSFVIFVFSLGFVFCFHSVFVFVRCEWWWTSCTTFKTMGGSSCSTSLLKSSAEGITDTDAELLILAWQY